jgi:hypothetical protein
MWQAVLLYNGDAEYKTQIEQIRVLLSELREKWQFEPICIEASRITPDQAFKYLRDIRSTSPQARGRIVASKMHVLPLSGKKNLNLLNTPVLILYESGRPITVYPHLLGTFYQNIQDSLGEIAKYGPSKVLDSRGILEDPICKILADDPSFLGSGLKAIGAEVSTSTGKIDLLLRNDRQTFIVIEIETHAGDSSVAQVCRLAAGYSKDNKIDLASVRKVVVCRSFDRNLVETARTAGVELYRIALTKEA